MTVGAFQRTSIHGYTTAQVHLNVTYLSGDESRGESKGESRVMPHRTGKTALLSPVFAPPASRER